MFTAEEIWQTYEPLKTQEKSVFLSKFFNEINPVDQNINNEDDLKIAIKDLVNQSIESARNNGLVKGSLDTNVEIICPEDLYKILESFGEELHFVFISSSCQVEKGQSLSIKVSSSDNEKCSRCWHKSSSVSQSVKHPELCSRCEENIEESGEVRRFV